MPIRRPVISAASPRQSSNSANDTVSVFSRKQPATAHIEPVSSRRPSFSMENILHPSKKDKKADEKERESRSEKRLSIVGVKATKSKDRTSHPSPRVGAAKPAKFDLIIESPPLVFYGNKHYSSGALFSGRLKLIVEDPTGLVKLNDFTMILQATISTTKPIVKDCKNCHERNDELKKWSFISEPTTYTKAKDNQFPFSYLFPGHLPATTRAHIGALSYALVAKATTSTGEKIEFVHPLRLQRAVPPGPEKSSIRIFPPTNLTGRVQLPTVVHPIGTFPVQMTLSGVVEKRAESTTRWRLRKMMWRIEEQCKVISSPCSKHAHKVSDGKAIQHTDVRTLGNDELKSGWKTDFDTVGGEIYLEFEASLATKSAHRTSCDVESAAGLEVKHTLIVELIVAEEFCPSKNPHLITPTGAARVLRMQFGLNVTERAGMGISWDEEMPPVYEEVPPSPPGYGTATKNDDPFGHAIAIVEDYNGPTIVPHDLERLTSTNADGLPHYREIDPQIINAGLPMRSRRDTNGSHESGESSNRRRLLRLQMDDLEAETPEDAYRRQRLEQDNTATTEEDYGEGVAGQTPA